MSNSTIGYVFEGGIHCPDCTRKRFPKFRGQDRDGNQIGAYTEYDAGESDSSTSCDDCHDMLWEKEDDEESLAYFPPLRLVR